MGDTSGKERTCQCRRCKRCRFHPWVGKSLWRRAWQPTLVFLSGKFHRQSSLVCDRAGTEMEDALRPGSPGTYVSDHHMDTVHYHQLDPTGFSQENDQQRDFPSHFEDEGSKVQRLRGWAPYVVHASGADVSSPSGKLTGAGFIERPKDAHILIFRACQRWEHLCRCS